jgi:hypothetical protein
MSLINLSMFGEKQFLINLNILMTFYTLNFYWQGSQHWLSKVFSSIIHLHMFVFLYIFIMFRFILIIIISVFLYYKCILCIICTCIYYHNDYIWHIDSLTVDFIILMYMYVTCVLKLLALRVKFVIIINHSENFMILSSFFPSENIC